MSSIIIVAYNTLGQSQYSAISNTPSRLKSNCSTTSNRWPIFIRLLFLLGLLLAPELYLINAPTHSFAEILTSVSDEHSLTEQINVNQQWRDQTSSLTNSHEMKIFLQPVRFNHPATMIRIGLPLNDGSAAKRTWIQIGERNAYSPMIISGTLSAKKFLTFDTSKGIAYTPYFKYTVIPSRSYLIRIVTTAMYSLETCTVLQDGYYEKAGISIAGIEVYSDKQRIDPYGMVGPGTTLKIAIHLDAPNINWSALRVHLSYRVIQSGSNSNEWISTRVKFKAVSGILEGKWTLPLAATPGQYDLKVEVTHPNGQHATWQELAEFSIMANGSNSPTLVMPASLATQNLNDGVTGIKPFFLLKRGTDRLSPIKDHIFMQLNPDRILGSKSQTDLLTAIYIPSRGWATVFDKSVQLPRGEEIWLLAYPLPVSSEDLPSKWTLTMSVRLQGGAWATLPPPGWFPDTTPDSWLAKWIIPGDTLLGPYDVRFEAMNSDGSWTTDQVINGAFTVLDDQLIYQEWDDKNAYINRTHQQAFPILIEANPPPVDYSISYIDQSHIQVVPQSSISQTNWIQLNFTTAFDFPVNSAEANRGIALVDMNGDGEIEIVRAVADQVEVRRISGELIWNYGLPALTDQIRVDDIDVDGEPEILVSTLMPAGSSFGRIVVLDCNGNLRWEGEVLSNAHGIAIWHPIQGTAGQVIVGNCANLVYLFSHDGILIKQKEIVLGEWSSIDSIAVGDIDGDSMDEFVLGVWRINQVDIWVLTPELETKWHMTLDSLGKSLGALTVFDGIALTPAPAGGKSIWVATSPLYYNKVVDPILFQIDGQSVEVIGEYHLDQYLPIQGASDSSELITVKVANWDKVATSTQVFVEVANQLLVFDSEGLQASVMIPGAKMLSASNVTWQPNGDAAIAVSYRSISSGSFGVTILKNPELFVEQNSTFLYDAATMQGRLIVTFTDILGLPYTWIVNEP